MNSIFFIIILLISAAMAGVFWPKLKQAEQRRKVLPVFILSILGCAIIYLYVGAPFVAEEIASYRAETRILEKRIASLETETAQTDDAQKLYDLGQLYLKVQAYPKAVETFRKAVLASDGNGATIFAYGKAHMMAAGGTVTPEAEKAFTMAAALMPSNPEPLFFLAIGKAQKGDVAEAEEALETLAQAYPNAQGLQKAIAEELARLKAKN